MFADVILPLSLNTLTYHFDDDLGVEVGDAVVVPMGQGSGRIYTAIVWRIHDQRPNFRVVRSIVKRLYNKPLLTHAQIKFWEWVADYYICSLGEVMRVALPSLIKPVGADIAEFERAQYRPRTERYISLSSSYRDDSLAQLLSKCERRAPKQYAALISFLDQSVDFQAVPRRLIDADSPTLQALARKRVILIEERELTLNSANSLTFRLPTLSDHQQLAFRDIQQSFGKSSTTLLHGVTGSGKTEVYIHLIAKTLERGGDALLLLPEIALTAQLIDRMERIFGARVISYHSKLSPQSRTERYLQLNAQDGGGTLIVGVRSAIFLPLRKLELIIVDEEHDPSYKQSDPAPRYNARDCAVAYAAMMGTHTLLGSATPSFESLMNKLNGKYGFASLAERYGKGELAKIFISDTRRAAKRGERRGHFNFDLLERMKGCTERGEQTILFQNRRGFAPFIECRSCSYTERCPHCNVTLTLHKSQNRLTCHYCGYSIEPPTRCPSCTIGEMVPIGFGTEKIEQQLSEIMPDSSVVRLDRDSVSSERAFKDIIGRFERGEAQIMVGTQMVTKGFDFAGVSLVAILNADNMLNSPDFRAEERAYQLMTQVAGRAGRRNDHGEVVIQTSQPDNRLLRYVVDNDYDSMSRDLLAEREMFFYPPYSRIIVITLRHKMQSLVNGAANYLAELMRQRFGARVQGPSTPPIDRVRDEFIVQIQLKVEHRASNAKARKALREILATLSGSEQYKNITISCDVDPQ